MIFVILGFTALIVLSEGIGRWLFKVLKYEPEYTMYAAPYGAAMLFCVLSILYLPIMVLHGSFGAILVVSMIVIAATMIPFLRCRKETLKVLCRARTLYIILAVVVIAVMFLKYGLQDMLQDAELLEMASYVNSRSIVLSSMPLQGYPLVGSIIIWQTGMNNQYAVLFLSLYTAAIGMMMSLNFIDSFQLPNPWFRFTLIFFSLFYCTFYSWKIVGAFHGENWRLYFTALAIYTAYRWLKTGKESIKYLLPIIFAAGLFVHSAYLMIAIEVVYCLAVFLFHEQKIRALYDLTTFMMPVAFYLFFWIGAKNLFGAILFGIVCLIYYMRRAKHKMYHKIIQIEDFLIAYDMRIFYVGIPVIFLVGTFILRFFIAGYGIEYGYYISYFSHRTVAGFLFPRGNYIDMVMDVWRWAGVIVFAKKAFAKEDRMIRDMAVCMIVFFVNPLCMGMLTQITGLETYACAFEILFNPFTDILVFIAIYQLFEWTVIGQWVLELCLVFATLLGHVASYTDLPMGLYSDLIKPSTASEVQQK